MRHAIAIVILILGLILAACGGSSGDPDGAAFPDAAPDAGTPREAVGSVEVIEDRVYYDDGAGPIEYRSGRVAAAFYQGGPPDFHREVTTAGACVLRRYTPSSCDPACPDGVCVAPDVCEPWPTLVSAGELTVTGLAAPVSITPQSGYYYSDPLPPELFADTASIRASLAGAELPAFSIDAGGVPALDTPIVDKIVLDPGEDHTVTWTPVGTGRVRLTINANNQGHGAPYMAIIECEVDDTAGAITVPAALVDAFPETMAWRICAGSDCPPSTLRRYRSGATAIGADQEVRLVVSSQRTFGVDHLLPD